MADPGLDWLLEHDPDAQNVSRREYGRLRGITLPSTLLDQGACEVEIAEDDKLTPWHCPACRQKANVWLHTCE